MDAKSLVLQQLFGALLQSAPMLAMNMLSQTDTGRPIQTGEIIPNDGVSFEQYPSYDYLTGLDDFADVPKTDSPFLGQGVLENNSLKRVAGNTPVMDFNPGDYDVSDLVLEADPYADVSASADQLPVTVRPHRNTAAFRKQYLPKMQAWESQNSSNKGPQFPAVSYKSYVDNQRLKRGLPALYNTLSDLDEDLYKDLPF